MKTLNFKKTAALLMIMTLFFISCKKNDDNLPTEPVPINLTQDQVTIVGSENSFAFDIFSKVLNSAGPGTNVIISPMSVSYALSMTVNGANSTTRDSIIKALKLNGITPESLNISYRDLTKALLSVDKRVLISIANSVWIRDNFVVKQDFIDILKNYYDAESGSFDINDPAAPDKINNWIDAKTNGLIRNMIDRIKDNTVMFLINAIYFKGKWQSQFDKAKTIDMPFYSAGGSSTDVPMMKQESEFKVYEGTGFVLAEFPYGQGNFVMDVILPVNQEGTNNLPPVITDASFNSWISLMHNMKVDLSFPRFKFGFKAQLKDILTAMGMGIAFTEGADFTNISEQYDLLIDDVTHQAFIETNEEGTEAAAATVVTVGVTSMPQILELKLDHPFIYFIRETTSNSILFMGRVADPSVN